MAKIVIPTEEQAPAAARPLKNITKIGSFLAAVILATSVVGCAASQGEMALTNGYDFQQPNDGGG